MLGAQLLLELETRARIQELVPGQALEEASMEPPGQTLEPELGLGREVSSSPEPVLMLVRMHLPQVLGLGRALEPELGLGREVACFACAHALTPMQPA